MASTSTENKKNFAIAWKAKIGGHKKQRTLVVKAYIQPTRHLAYALAKEDANRYAKGSVVREVVVLNVQGVARDSYYSTHESPGFSN